MERVSRDVAFWLAVGIASIVVSGLAKTFAARFQLPEGLETWIAAAT